MILERGQVVVLVVGCREGRGVEVQFKSLDDVVEVLSYGVRGYRRVGQAQIGELYFLWGVCVQESGVLIGDKVWGLRKVDKVFWDGVRDFRIRFWVVVLGLGQFRGSELSFFLVCFYEIRLGRIFRDYFFRFILFCNDFWLFFFCF